MSRMTTPSIAGLIDRAPPRTRRRIPRVRMSVRASMVVVLVLAVGPGWFVHRGPIQQDALAAIWRAGGNVGCDRRCGGGHPRIVPDEGNWPALR
jgi:hypothetical protein